MLAEVEAARSGAAGMTSTAGLGTEDHPQARIVLAAELERDPSHAYLFHGPAGTGKSTAARAFAAALLAEGSDDPESVRRRVGNGTHPDLTWVRPTGAHVMRVEDVEGPVVSAATRTPFESKRRVFVLERVDTMNDEVANRLLKTLEEPAHFVHVILLTEALGRVLDTVISRCQLVRFDPLPAARIAAALEAEGVPAETALACAGLSLGNATRARYLASEEGAELRAEVDRFVAAALGEETVLEPWRPAPGAGRARPRRGGAGVQPASASSAWSSSRRAVSGDAMEREMEEAGKREGRRARTRVLDLALTLTELAFRDLVCVAEGAPEAVLAVDSPPDLVGDARSRDARRLREAAERCEETRQSLELNVTEELALSVLGFRLAELAGGAGLGAPEARVELRQQRGEVRVLLGAVPRERRAAGPAGSARRRTSGWLSAARRGAAERPGQVRAQHRAEPEAAAQHDAVAVAQEDVGHRASGARGGGRRRRSRRRSSRRAGRRARRSRSRARSGGRKAIRACTRPVPTSSTGMVHRPPVGLGPRAPAARSSELS